MQDVEKIKNELLTFPFELFDNVFSQRSFIDIGRINAHTPEAALNFIQNYILISLHLYILRYPSDNLYYIPQMYTL